MAAVEDTNPLAQPVEQPEADRASAEEVRVAMALNGGVSLAVWMGGCAVELDAARRAHLGPEAMEPEKTVLGGDVSPPTRTLYHALCAAFHRELVIDLMTGSSAGGINGALLAAAIQRRRRLHPSFIRERWIGLGDFGQLLHSLREERPTSLMSGEKFHQGLRDTFDALLPDETKAAGAEDDCRLQIGGEQAERTAILNRTVMLEVTTTDVAGEERRFRDEWGEELIAREYRQRFKFLRPQDFKPDALAQAARSSASFPLAFEPQEVQGERLGLAGTRWVLDGGLLDNAPIRSVLELIPSRPSLRAVKRFACYVNADPPLDASVLLAAEQRAAARAGGSGAPKPAPKDEQAAAGPTLESVLGYMVNLPRKATFVDQLNAIQAAAQRSLPVEEANRSLIALEPATLLETATALLPAYRSRRRVLSLGERLQDRPADVQCADRHIRRVGGELPWIPLTMAPPVARGEWGWGVRAAQRIHHLLLDLIRHQALALEPGTQESADAARVLASTRARIYKRLERLDRVHEVITSDGHIGALVVGLTEPDGAEMALCGLRCRMRDRTRDGLVHHCVREAARAVFALGDALGVVSAPGEREVSVHEALFGPPPEPAPAGAAPVFDEERFRCFLERTLAVEVVRRAFSADDEFDTDQPLAFAQITPCAPTLLLDDTPLSARDAPATPDEKLTGTQWGHFAGFYRASWRANDFMWGRLDAAVRIVDMLVDGARATRMAREGTNTATVLANELWPAQGEEDAVAEAKRWLIAEALVENDAIPPDQLYRVRDWRAKRLAGYLKLEREQLHETLEQALTADLRGEKPMLTRAVCVRAAQLEILQHELPHVVALSRADVIEGAATDPVPPLPEAPRWTAVISGLRRDPPLPRRLGAHAKAEQGSALMIRTASQSALVGLAALRGTKLPLARLLYIPGTLLLPAAGVVARRRAWAIAVAVTFWLLALFVGGRLLSVGATKDSPDAFSVIVTYVAAAGILSVCVVPFWRAVRAGDRVRTVKQGLWCAALVAAGLGASVAAAIVRDGDVGRVALQKGADKPTWILLALALATLSLVRYLPKWVRWMGERATAAPFAGGAGLLRILPWAALAAWAAYTPLRGELHGHRALTVVGLILVGLSPLAVALAYVAFSSRRWHVSRRR